MKYLKPALLTLLVAAVYVLHQDFWNWKKAGPLVFGFLPVGLAYHAGYSVLAALTMAVLVRFAWPKHLEQAAPEGPASGAEPAARERLASGPPAPTAAGDSSRRTPAAGPGGVRTPRPGRPAEGDGEPASGDERTFTE